MEMINPLAKHKIPVDPTLDIYEAMLKGDIKEKYLWPKVLRLTKMMYDGGVKILSGTDLPNFGLIPGKAYIMNLSFYKKQELVHQIS